MSTIQLRATCYIEYWPHRLSQVCLEPGVYDYELVHQMFGEAFLRERMADGSLVLMPGGQELREYADQY